MQTIRLFSIFFMALFFSSCTVTKRKHLPGYDIKFHKKYRSIHSEINQEQVNLIVFDTNHLDKIQKINIVEAPFAEIDSKEIIEGTNTVDDEVSHLSKVNVQKKGAEKHIETLAIVKNQVKKESEEKAEKKKIKKGWKIFWFTLLGIVLFAAFLYVGARWPVAYVVWFGLTALIALVDIFLSLGDGDFWSRFSALIGFSGLTLFYVWLDTMMFSVITALFWEMAVIGSLVLIFLIIYWITKAKIKKVEGNS